MSSKDMTVHKAYKQRTKCYEILNNKRIMNEKLPKAKDFINNSLKIMSLHQLQKSYLHRNSRNCQIFCCPLDVIVTFCMITQH